MHCGFAERPVFVAQHASQREELGLRELDLRELAVITGQHRAGDRHRMACERHQADFVQCSFLFSLNDDHISRMSTEPPSPSIPGQARRARSYARQCHALSATRSIAAAVATAMLVRVRRPPREFRAEDTPPRSILRALRSISNLHRNRRVGGQLAKHIGNLRVEARKQWRSGQAGVV